MTALVVLAGAVGAAARASVGNLLVANQRGRWATWVVNLVGSVGLGLLAGRAAVVGSATWTTVVGAGFLGAFTTFSAVAADAAGALGSRRWPTALAMGLGMLALAVVAAWVGMIVGEWWAR